jgi:type I restriction enzyme M protein
MLTSILKKKFSLEEFPFILYLLSLERDGFINSETNEKNEEFIRVIYESLQESKTEKAKIYLEFLPKNETFIYAIVKNSLIKEYFYFSEKVFSIFPEDFPEVFEHLLFEFLQSKSKSGGESIQPIELTRFINNLIEIPEYAKIFNPFAGLASFGISLELQQEYHGQEINSEIWMLGILRLIAHDKSNITNFSCEDSIKNWPPKEKKFDLIISHPPLGMKVYDDSKSKTETVGCFFINNGIRSLKSDGKLVALLANGILYDNNSGERSLRENLIDNDLLEMIISLPVGILSNTGIPIVILVIDLKKENRGVIKFVNGENFIDRNSSTGKVFDDFNLLKEIKSNSQFSNYIINVSIDQIKKNDYDLNVSRYFIKKVDGISLREILEPIKKNFHKHNDLVKLIRVRDLKDDNTNAYLNVELIEKSSVKGPGIIKIEESCILLATKWNTLRPTWFEYNGIPIFIRTSDILAFKVKRDIIDVEYLINELYADYVIEQVSSFRRGVVIPFIRKEDLLEIVIKIPSSNLKSSLELQRAKIQGIKEEASKAKQTQQDLNSKLNKIIEDQTRDFQSLKHTIRQYLSPLKSNLSGTRKFLKNHEGKPIFLDMIYSKNLNQTLDQHLSGIEKIIDSINLLISGNEKRFFKTGSINLFDLIVDCQNKFKEEEIFSFTEPEIDEESFLDSDGNFVNPIIGLSEDQFETLFSNVVDNAKKFGFKGRKIGNSIKIWVSHENGFVHLSISNNGHPFAEGFTIKHLTTLGEKTTDSLGSGIGGADIKKIVESANGTFDISSDPEAPIYKVSYNFKFPLIIEEK